MVVAEQFLHPEVETLGRAKLEGIQSERLRWQIHRCYDQSPFYRERFDAAGVRPEHVRTVADLRNIPFVTKQELREEQLKFPPLGRYVIAPKAEWAEIHPSTGTTGAPVNTIWSRDDVKNITEVTARTMWSFGVRPADIIQNAYSYGLWVGGMACHYASRHLGCFVIPIGAAMTNRQIDYIARLGSTVLLATPSYALYIAESLREAGISPEQIDLRIGAFGGEGGTQMEATRRKMENGLGIDAYDYFGLGEIGPTMASECVAKAGLHWSEDHHVIEVVNPETKEPCAPGELGVLVITHLTRQATPMIRYWTNDYARLDLEPCACGRTHARSVGGVMGRADDMVIYRGAKFYPIQVEKVVRGFAELGDEFQIRVERDEETLRDKCTVVAEWAGAAPDSTSLETRLKHALREEILVTPSVELLPPGSLERTTFKAKRIEDLRPAKTEAR